MVKNGIYDVLIIGGGPAGSTAATLLSKQGYKVRLFEKEKFPRDHVGESLLPFCYHIFKELGVLEKLTGKFVRKPGVRFIDAEGLRSTTWCFNHVIKDPSYLSFQVTRAEFDQILLENARSAGAIVEEETRVDRVELSESGDRVAATTVGPDGARESHEGRFLLDASGRGALVATSMGWRKNFEGLDRTALWTHFENANLIAGLEEGLSLIVYLGGDKKGWIWIFPLDESRLTVGVVLNNDYIRGQKAKLTAEGFADWKEALFYQEFKSSPLARQIMEGTRQNSHIRVEGNYSYYVDPEKKFGHRYALVGDASTFIDPIFSSGIFLSMNGSRLVSRAIGQMLQSANVYTPEPFAEAYAKINGAYKLVFRLITLFYTPHSISFAEAGVATQLDHLRHESSMAAGHFLLAGDFFERHERYHEFIDLLQSPSLFEKFKSSVIDREQFRARSCEVKSHEVFPSLQKSPMHSS